MLATLVILTESVRQVWTESVRQVWTESVSQLWTESVRQVWIVTPTRMLVPAVLILPLHQRAWPKAKGYGKSKGYGKCKSKGKSTGKSKSQSTCLLYLCKRKLSSSGSRKSFRAGGPASVTGAGTTTWPCCGGMRTCTDTRARP
jgi:hypothetical protein